MTSPRLRPNGTGLDGDGSRRPELAEADSLAAEGHRLAAIELLTAANRRQRDSTLEERLVELRYDAVAELEESTPFEPWPRSFPDPFPDVTGQPPEIPADRLDTAVMGGAILNHGCLALRGLIDPSTVKRLVHDIDQAIATMERWKDDPTVQSPFFVPFEPTDGNSVNHQRHWVGFHHCVLVNDCPSALFQLLEALGSTNVFECIAEYFGERPLLSIHKSTFRISRPRIDVPGWHQDGAFIGREARAINIWMPLTDCGGDALVPGLDVLPRRYEEIFEPTGPPLANQVPWEKVLELEVETPEVRPEFTAGDALLFDEKLVHSTGRSPEQNGNRYGIEFWLFAQSSFPSHYLPMVV